MIEKEWSNRLEALEQSHQSLMKDREEELEKKDKVIIEKVQEFERMESTKNDEITTLKKDIKELQTAIIEKVQELEQIELTRDNEIETLRKEVKELQKSLEIKKDDVNIAHQFLFVSGVTVAQGIQASVF